uniref:Uncharacterized protein n=1 Tax=Balaenoptera musculus TaxID=9771 RepID=A0A8C0I575_BALMU
NNQKGYIMQKSLRNLKSIIYCEAMSLCVCVCPHFLGAKPKANHMAPTPILEAHVAMLTWVTVYRILP